MMRHRPRIPSRRSGRSTSFLISLSRSLQLSNARGRIPWLILDTNKPLTFDEPIRLSKRVTYHHLGELSENIGFQDVPIIRAVTWMPRLRCRHPDGHLKTDQISIALILRRRDHG
jgi:hypothetical protein